MVSQYVRTSWGPEKGFTGGSTSSIAQTDDGYLWIGTDRGLIRFDGVSFRKFEQAAPNPFPIGPVKTLLADEKGDLWVLLQSTKLLRYHAGMFELIRGEAENGITAICRGPTGGVLASSLAKGTLAYDGKQFRTVSAGPVFEDPVARANGVPPDERNTRLSWSTGVTSHLLAAPTSAVISMAATGDGRIWLGTENKGLFLLTARGNIAVPYGLLGEKITNILPLQGGQLWIGTNTGVVRWTGTEFSHSGVPAALQHVAIHSLITDSDSNIWVGSARGLLRYNANGVSIVPEKASITKTSVSALFEDREHNLWIGASGSLERLRDSVFVTYTLSKLKSQSMGSVYVDSRGRTWIAPIEGGLRWLKGEENGTVTAAGIANDIVYSITGTDKDDVWVGRKQGGLTHLRYSGNSFTAKTYTKTDGLAQNSVYAVYESRDGSVWSGTLSGGISELKEGHFTNYTATDGLASDTVSSIAEGADGAMWFGTPKGLSEFSKNEWRTYGVRDGLVSQDINCLLKDSGGVLWIGTAGGLAFLRNGRVQTPPGTQPWLTEPIFGIADDRSGSLWIATSARVLRVKRASLTNNQALDDSAFRIYGWDNGLEGTEGIKRFRSVVEDSQGKVWFSTSHGLSVVNPDRSAVNSLPALLRVETVTVDGNEVNLEQPIRVPSGEHRIVFHYLGLTLANPERVRYRYRLDGFDRGWSEVTSNREATFANLSPGKYQFRLMCSNADGIWNNQGASIDLSVLPTFYQTNWFRMLSIATFFALLWGIYQLRVQQLQRRFNIGLEARVNERTRIARELHDTLLQTFHGALFQFQAARNLMRRQPDEAMQSLDDAISETKKALAESREAIQDLRSEPIAKGNLPELLMLTSRELADSHANEHPPVFDLIEEGDRKRLSSTLSNDICRIALELMRNAYQHANAKRIEAELRYGDSTFRLRIRDDGSGIDPKVLKEGGRIGHWGLRGVRERAERIGASLDLWSEPGSGTEAQLLVPAEMAYESAPDSYRAKLARKVKSRA